MFYIKIVVIVIVLIAKDATPLYAIHFPQKVKPESPKCLPMGKPCLVLKYPCCPINYKGNTTRPSPVICFKFGKGICQDVNTIDNLKVYNQLVKKLNDTNFQMLKKKYWATVSHLGLLKPSTSKWIVHRNGIYFIPSISEMLKHVKPTVSNPNPSKVRPVVDSFKN